MKNNLILVIVCFLLNCSAALADSNVTAYLDGKFFMSGTESVVEIYDDLCKRNLGKFTVIANQKTAIYLCASYTGYGSVLYRNLTNGQNGWTEKPFVHNGDSIYP